MLEPRHGRVRRVRIPVSATVICPPSQYNAEQDAQGTTVTHLCCGYWLRRCSPEFSIHRGCRVTASIYAAGGSKGAAVATALVGDDHMDSTGRTSVDGGDGCAHTRAARDDVQLIHGACQTVLPDGIIVRPGPDGVFDTLPAGGHERATVTGYCAESIGFCVDRALRRCSIGP